MSADLQKQVLGQAHELRTLRQQVAREMERRAEPLTVRSELRRDEDSRPPASPEAGRSSALAEQTQLREEAQRGQAELLERLRQAEGECRQREGERDEARARARELELRLDELASASSEGDREKALEMELGLLRARLAREEDRRAKLEMAASQAESRAKMLQKHLEQSSSETRLLRRSLAEQTELAAFRQEVCDDLKRLMQDHRAEAEEEVHRERSKFAAIQRLEGILPRSLLAKAMAS